MALETLKAIVSSQTKPNSTPYMIRANDSNNLKQNLK